MRTAGRTRRTITSVLTGTFTVALVALLPRAVGTSWVTVGALLGRLSLPAIAVLALVWIAGLWAHSFVLAASLPGLTKRRGLTLSLTGSAVANVLPLGGAAGTGLNFAMTRRWARSWPPWSLSSGSWPARTPRPRQVAASTVSSV